MPPVVLDTFFPDVKLLVPHVYTDVRGQFFEAARLDTLQALPGFGTGIQQSNTSVSGLGVLRGLHYQHRHVQGKLLQVLQGRVFDVVVDVRQASPRFGRWAGFELSAQQPRLLWVPPGYAHGFVALADHTVVQYQCTAYYAPEHEVCLAWDDPQVAVDWPVSQPILSDKDRQGLALAVIQQRGLCL